MEQPRVETHSAEILDLPTGVVELFDDLNLLWALFLCFWGLFVIFFRGGSSTAGSPQCYGILYILFAVYIVFGTSDTMEDRLWRRYVFTPVTFSGLLTATVRMSHSTHRLGAHDWAFCFGGSAKEAPTRSFEETARQEGDQSAVQRAGSGSNLEQGSITVRRPGLSFSRKSGDIESKEGTGEEKAQGETATHAASNAQSDQAASSKAKKKAWAFTGW
eukprot:CAMPEP_0172594124 /NCGR_PEP_ID=MMETSP1068-20121228/13445_1 /TAXON_ID=35684 /ORGANISM="Pseudopedinella elastica, Strain CCMP716" /LENGTH=216 /DNA_ID=CAMNT_0013391981 /DNA_START=250 /DNA_END=897 /DNA_ORIENTATION=-